jgi:hypothetical protein
MMSKNLRSIAGAVAGLVAAAAAWADSTYLFTLDSQASALGSALSVLAPTSGTLIGVYNAVGNPTGTRTKPGLFGTFGDTENVAVPVTVSIAIAGDSTTNPTGSFLLRLDEEAGEAGLSGLSLDLLGGDEPAISVTANVNWSSFRTRNPTCTLLGGITIPIPLGQAVISTLTAVQGSVEAVGTLVPTGPSTFAVTIPVEVDVSLGASFLEQEIPPTPQLVPVVFAAEVTLDGQGGASISVSLDGLELSQEQPGPIGDPFSLPFTEPLCQGNLNFDLQVQSLSAESSLNAALVAAGEKQIPSCPCDWDASGAVGVPDIFAYLASWFAAESRADFDGSGGIGVPDIFAFLACWFSRPGTCT